MKIHILFPLKKGPWGGGNQFLKSLRNELLSRKVYAEKPFDADVILFNSFPFGHEDLFHQAIKLKQQGKLLVHRIDGPIYKIREADLAVDRAIYRFNDAYVDGTIFQSEWSRKANIKQGMLKKAYETIILNSPDPLLFHPPSKPMMISNDEKIKLIATSWSSNSKKGFSIYEYLDENLDFSKYEMTFIGNSPVRFKNIRMVQPLPSEKIAEQLRRHHIFVTASQDDPCSNSLIEALHCGLPAVFLKDGGHLEIVGHGGVSFHSKSDVMQAILKVSSSYKTYKQNISSPSLKSTTDEYTRFMENIWDDFRKQKYSPKATRFLGTYFFLSSVYLWKILKVIDYRVFSLFR